MKKIISKIDYTLKNVGDKDPSLALELWDMFKERSFLLEQSARVVESKQTHEKRVFAPAICHMILSNPDSVDESFYKKVVLSILKDNNLSRLTVFGDMSYLYLILLHSNFEFNEFFVELIIRALHSKGYDYDCTLRHTDYSRIKKVSDNGMKEVTQYKDRNVIIGLNNNELETFERGEHISISERVSFAEIKALKELVHSKTELDHRIRMAIDMLYAQAININITKGYMNSSIEEAPKL